MNVNPCLNHTQLLRVKCLASSISSLAQNYIKFFTPNNCTNHYTLHDRFRSHNSPLTAARRHSATGLLNRANHIFTGPLRGVSPLRPRQLASLVKRQNLVLLVVVLRRIVVQACRTEDQSLSDATSAKADPAADVAAVRNPALQRNQPWCQVQRLEDAGCPFRPVALCRASPHRSQITRSSALYPQIPSAKSSREPNDRVPPYDGHNRGACRCKTSRSHLGMERLAVPAGRETPMPGMPPCRPDIRPGCQTRACHTPEQAMHAAQLSPKADAGQRSAMSPGPSRTLHKQRKTLLLILHSRREKQPFSP